MKSIKIPYLIFSILGILLICLSTFLFLPSYVMADSFINDNAIAVSVKGTNNNTLSGTNVPEFTQGSLKRYNWSESKKFEIDFNSEKISSNEAVKKDEQGKYNYNIIVEYVNEYPQEIREFDGNAQYKMIKYYQNTQSTTDLSSLSKIVLDVATLKENITEQLKSLKNNNEEIINKCFGWGVYRFSIEFYNATTVNATISSNLVGLTPSAFKGIPNIDRTIASSQTGLINAYNCFLTNKDIEYIDINTIKWYVKGETVDGKTYVLTEQDLLEMEGNDFLYTSIERTGTTFHFDSKNLAGTWEIYCEVTPHSIDNEPAQSIKSNVLSVETGNRISSTTIIWWIVGGVSLLVLIVIITIIITKKKEKVW